MSGPPDLRGLAPSSRPTPPGPLARGGHVVSKPKPPKKPRKGLRKKNPERSARVHDQALGPQSRLCRLMPCCVTATARRDRRLCSCGSEARRQAWRDLRDALGVTRG